MTYPIKDPTRPLKNQMTSSKRLTRKQRSSAQNTLICLLMLQVANLYAQDITTPTKDELKLRMFQKPNLRRKKLSWLLSVTHTH